MPAKASAPVPLPPLPPPNTPPPTKAKGGRQTQPKVSKNEAAPQGLAAAGAGQGKKLVAASNDAAATVAALKVAAAQTAANARAGTPAGGGAGAVAIFDQAREEGEKLGVSEAAAMQAATKKMRTNPTRNVANSTPRLLPDTPGLERAAQDAPSAALAVLEKGVELPGPGAGNVVVDAGIGAATAAPLEAGATPVANGAGAAVATPGINTPGGQSFDAAAWLNTPRTPADGRTPNSGRASRRTRNR